LYTTTFPCHNCARHIIAAGIKKVFYIEPYEKSLALELHADSIELEPPDEEVIGKKVIFLHFEGVAPRQYSNLFLAKEERKQNGKAIAKEPVQAIPVLPEYLDNFFDFESKVAEHLEELGLAGIALKE